MEGGRGGGERGEGVSANSKVSFKEPEPFGYLL